jgi:hypothetical protein
LTAAALPLARRYMLVRCQFALRQPLQPACSHNQCAPPYARHRSVGRPVVVGGSTTAYIDAPCPIVAPHLPQSPQPTVH